MLKNKLNTERKKTKDRKRKNRTKQGKKENIRDEMKLKNICTRRLKVGKGEDEEKAKKD